MIMLDICCGLCGASAAFRDRGWEVITVDIDPQFNPDIIADIRTWHYNRSQPDFVWFSPPCNEFSRESMPWSRVGKVPDLSIVNACMRLKDAIQARFWVLENVRGAVPYLGQPRARYGAFYLWGYFPDIGSPVIAYRKKESYGSNQRAERAKIPYRLSLAMAIAVESQIPLFDFQGEVVNGIR